MVAREKLIKQYFYADYTYDEIVSLLKKFHNVYIFLRQLKRIIKVLGLKRKNVTENLEDICKAIIKELNGSGSCLGYKTVWRRLRQIHGLNVKINTILEILHILDPDGIAERLKYRLKRRMYSVAVPNFIWHMDGYDKLKPFGFAIHGGIDGCSRKVLWVNVGTSNNKPEVIAYYYLETVQKFGCIPTLVRSDNGSENTAVKIIQKALRFEHKDKLAGFNSFLKSKSTANQRIESFWGQMRRQCIDFYIVLFKEMRDNGLFNNANETHIECLRYCFGPLIQYDLNVFRKEWNRHKIRKQKGRELIPGKPNILFYQPEKFDAEDCRMSIKDVDVQFCYKEYSKVSTYCNPIFDELVKVLVPDFTNPTTVEQALLDYEKIIKSIDNYYVEDM